MISFERFRKKTHQNRERQRFLNIIYFVDASRTRSFNIPLRTVYWAGGLAALVVVWSVLGTGFLVHESWLANKNASKTRFLLDALFQYQARYDEVYERAYTKEPAPAQIAAAEEAESTAKPQAQAGVKTLAAKNLPAKTQDLGIEAAKSADEPAISLEGVKSRMRENELQVSFDVRNNDKPNLATGHLWGVAKFVADSDQIGTYVPSPSNVPVNGVGEAPDFRGGHAFSIRHFKAKTMSFFVPTGIKGAFTEVKIFLRNDRGFTTNITIPVLARETKRSEPSFNTISKQVNPQPEQASEVGKDKRGSATTNPLDTQSKTEKKGLTAPTETTNTTQKQLDSTKVSPAPAPSAQTAPLPQSYGGALDSMDEDHPVDDEQVEENGN